MGENLKSGYVTIGSIVDSVIADLDEGTTHNWDRYLHFALRGVQTWQMDSAQEVITKILTPNGYNAIDFPDDYLDWTKVGIQLGDKIITFGVNDDIALEHDTDECGNPKLNSPADCNCTDYHDGYGGYWFHNVINEYGEHLGKSFGYGGGGSFQGYFRVDKDRKQIQFDGNVSAKKIYLEYISNGFDPCSETMVNKYAEDLIRTYIHWQRAIFKHGRSSSEAQAWGEDYDTQLRLSRARVFSITKEEVIELSRKSYKLSIKN